MFSYFVCLFHVLFNIFIFSVYEFKKKNFLLKKKSSSKITYLKPEGNNHPTRYPNR